MNDVLCCSEMKQRIQRKLSSGVPFFHSLYVLAKHLKRQNSTFTRLKLTDRGPFHSAKMSMDESQVYDDDPAVSGYESESSRLQYRKEEKSQRLLNVLKYSLLKLAINGADIVLMDSKSFKVGALENTFDSSFHEQKWVCKEPTCYSLKEVKYSEYNNSTMNILAVFSLAAMKIIGFQYNLFLNFLKFPFRLCYFSLMLLVFPFQTLREIRRCLTKCLLRMCGISYRYVVSVAFGYLDAQRSRGIKMGKAVFWAMAGCFMLLGLLFSNFLVGGFLMKILVENPIQIKQALNFDYTKPSPVAFVHIAPYSAGVGSKGAIEADNRANTRIIPYNRKVQLIVTLTLPESEYNRKLGVFQVRVESLSSNGNVTASSSYPCMLKYKSKTIYQIETLLKLATLITGLQSESQILNMKTSHFTEGLNPTTSLKVTLEQRSGIEAGAGLPETYGASIGLETELPKLKRFIWNWRRTLFVWTSFMFFFLQLVVVVLFFTPILVPQVRSSIIKRQKFSNSKMMSWYSKG